jgi:hypothetical protein
VFLKLDFLNVPYGGDPMNFKRQLIIRAAIAGVLALVFAGLLVFNSEGHYNRSSRYVWLSEAGAAERIVIGGANGALEFSRRNGEWFVGDYPAKTERVQDLLDFLSRSLPYPVRASSAASHVSLGLTEGEASRIAVFGGTETLLDLLVGGEDSAGREVFLRRNGEDQVRSGEASSFSAYLGGDPIPWYRLKLLPALPGVDMVQRISLVASAASPEASVDAATDAPFSIYRQEGGWYLERGTGEAEAVAVDTLKAETFVRTVLEAEGRDFLPPDRSPETGQNQVQIDFGDGSRRTLLIGAAAEDGSRPCEVSGSPYRYSLSRWTTDRIFAGPDV